MVIRAPQAPFRGGFDADVAEPVARAAPAAAPGRIAPVTAAMSAAGMPTGIDVLDEDERRHQRELGVAA